MQGPMRDRPNHFRAYLLVLAFALFPVPASAQSTAAPVLAAASDLKFALEEIAAKFSAETKR